jgi:ATP synthase F1 complex assembly factor 2
MQEILEYFQTDSVCFLENRYSSLFETQMHLWGPLRDSASHILGVRVETTEKLVSGNIQTERAAKCLQRYLEELDVWSCAAFHSITSWSKSAVIALNVQHGSISAEQAVRAARCVEDWQSHRYGFVEGEHDVDRAFLGVSIGAASILCRMAKIHPNTFARASDLLRSTHI